MPCRPGKRYGHTNHHAFRATTLLRLMRYEMKQPTTTGSVASRFVAFAMRHPATKDTIVHLLARGALPHELARMWRIAGPLLPMSTKTRDGDVAWQLVAYGNERGLQVANTLRVIEMAESFTVEGKVVHDSFEGCHSAPPTTCPDILCLRKEISRMERFLFVGE